MSRNIFGTILIPIVIFDRHFACEEDREEEVKMLLEHGADPNILNKEKKTPLQMAPDRLANMIRQKS